MVATTDHGYDDEDGSDGDATEVRLRKAPIAAGLLRKKGLGHLLSLREPTKGGSSSQSAVTTGRVEHVAISKEKSSSQQSPARERGDGLSPASPPSSESVPAAGPSTARLNGRETAKSVEQQHQQPPHITPKIVEVVAARSAGGSHQHSGLQNVGSSVDHATRVEHDHQQQQKSAILTPPTEHDEGSCTTANEAPQNIEAALTTGEGADEGEHAEPVPAAPVRRRRRVSAAPSNMLGDAGRSTTTPDADSAPERSDSDLDLGIASRLRTRKRKATAPADPHPVSPPSSKKRSKGKAKAVVSSEEGERKRAEGDDVGEVAEAIDEIGERHDVGQTGIKEEAPSGKATRLYRGYEKNKAAVIELFGGGWEVRFAYVHLQSVSIALRAIDSVLLGSQGATLSQQCKVTFGRRLPLRLKTGRLFAKSHRKVLLRYDLTSLRPHISLVGTSDPAKAAKRSGGWVEISIDDLFTDGARQNLDTAAFDILEGLGVFWADKYCKWLPETVWRKYDEERETVRLPLIPLDLFFLLTAALRQLDRFEGTNLFQNLIDGRLTVRPFTPVGLYPR